MDITDRRLHIGLLTGFWLVIYPYISFAFIRHRWDEGVYYVPTAERMLTHGQWIVPHLFNPPHHGGIFFEKPPLGLWSMAVSMKIFGMSLFAARLPSILLGLGTGLLVYHIATTIYDWRVGITAGLFYLGNPFVTINNHSATSADLDIYYVFFGTAFVWLLWQHYDDQRWMIVAGLCGAAGVLAKSFAMGMFLVVLLPLVALYRERYLSRKVLVGGVSGLVVLLPWPVAAYLLEPEAFAQQMIFRQIGRAQGEFGAAAYFPMLLGIDDWTNGALGILTDPGSSGQLIVHIGPVIMFYLSIVGTILGYIHHKYDMKGTLFVAWWALSVPLFLTVFKTFGDWHLQPIIVPLSILSGVVLDFAATKLQTGKENVYNAVYVAFIFTGASSFYIVWYIMNDNTRYSYLEYIIGILT